MNWFKKKSQIVENTDELLDEGFGRPPIRFRATFPIDVWVDDVGDIEREREEAYNIIKDSLDSGLNEHALNGHNYELYQSDPKTDAEIWES